MFNIKIKIVIRKECLLSRLLLVGGRRALPDCASVTE